MNGSANPMVASLDGAREHLKTTFVHVVDGMRVVVYDGLLSAPTLRSLYDVVSRAAYTRSETARTDTAEHRHWATEISLPTLPAMPFMAPTARAVAHFAGSAGYRCYRSYVNVAHFGDLLLSHVDCLPGAGEITALWYVCERWDHEWGGETVFFDADQEARALVSPKPGRLVLFDGALLHAGKPPNRNCYLPRYTLALKFERNAQVVAAGGG